MNRISASEFHGLSQRVCDSAFNNPDRVAFTFLEFQGRSQARQERPLTTAELDRRARGIAVELLATCAPGDRALLLFKPGIDFVTAFLGCLYAGVIAVPSALPKHGLGAARTLSILRDSEAAVVLSTAGAIVSIQEHLPEDAALIWLATDEISGADDPSFRVYAPAPDAPAMLQYSSGSTGEPKGVVITHGNLIDQAELIFAEVGAKAFDNVLTWLPIFHDMGLMSSVVMPMAMEMHSVFMAPEAFVLRPARWLRALSDFRTNYCAAPDFGFALCARKIVDEDLDGVDLSALRYAVCGAEPVRATTLERFDARFSRYGFPREKIYPAYGLAEATLLVAGNATPAQTATFDGERLGEGRAVAVAEDASGSLALVSCGPACGSIDLRVVDPETLVELPEGQVGEIWLQGGSVGLGYWGANAHRNSSFNGRLKGGNGKAYLRTGDFGFLHEGALFVRGRIKDLIIIRGVNHHASDIEHTVERSHPALAVSGGAAFGIQIDDQERVVIVHELERGQHDLPAGELAAVVSQLRRQLSEQHELIPHAVWLLRGGIPKTTSGKVRRNETRERFLDGSLKPVYQWCETDADEPHAAAPGHVAEDASVRRQIDMEIWLIRTLATLRGIDPSRYIAQTELTEFVADSDLVRNVAKQVKREFGLAVPFTMFTDHSTIGELASYLVEGVSSNNGDTAAVGGRLSSDALQAILSTTTDGVGINNGGEDQRVAIVGIASRFPSADGPAEFWNNLCSGVDAVTTIPPERWDCDALYDENPLAVGKMNTRRGGFLRDIENFDARFFGIQAREATRMDPAHRVLLELSWEAFEDAGVVPSSLSGASIGVYIGISGSDYAQLQFGDETLSDPYAGVGCALTNAASRISHFHNLRGPALAVDTACSSSLSSLHLGCMAIRSGECDMVLAGGVNIILSPNVTISLSKAGMMAPDGRCKAFDGAADGYVRSEGAGLVLLKPYAKAIEDGDEIYAVIRGSATNQDGRSSAISAPNGEAQQRVVMAACQDAGVLPGQLDYVEAHGTGTAIGDPIEVNALGEVLRVGVDNDGTCGLGSVKTNIGHCESAAGIASIIKAAHILKTGQVPPSLHFNEPNPLIPFHDFRVKVQERLAPLPNRGRLRMVGVNSFGIGGTNVHVVLEETGPVPAMASSVAAASNVRPWLVPVSARSEKSLKQYAGVLAAYLRGQADAQGMADIQYTLAERRTHHSHRIAVAGQTAADLANALEQYQQTGYASDVTYGYRAAGGAEAPRVAFVFSGQGAQWWAMGRGLFATEPTFRREIERCDAALAPHTQWSLIDVLMADEADSLLGETAYAQPTLFALQVSLVALLAERGVAPDAVVGHSFGEVAAACTSGVLAFDDACRLIALRARLMQPVKGLGRMVSIEMPRAQMAALLSRRYVDLSVAASNSPTSTVVSGPHESLDRLVAEISATNVMAVELGHDFAFHSGIMDGVRAEFVQRLADLQVASPRIPLLSTVSAQWCDASRPLDASYWGENIRQEVRFAEAIESMAREGFSVFVEIGAHPVLSGGMSRTLKASSANGTAIAVLERGLDDQRALARCLGTLFAQGRSLDWRALSNGGRFVRDLPRYQWDRQRYWIDAPHHEVRNRASTHPLVTLRLPVAQPTWQSRLDLQTNPFLSGVRMRGEGGLSNGLFVEVAFEARHPGVAAEGVRELVDLHFTPVGLDGGEALPTVQTTVLPPDGAGHAISVALQTDSSKGRAEHWHEAMRCRVVTLATGADELGRMSVEALRARYPQRFSSSEIYRKFGEIGVDHAQPVHIAEDVWLDESGALLSLRLRDLARGDMSRYTLHPLVFEAIEQACRIAAGSGLALASLSRIRRLRVAAEAAEAAYVYCELMAPDAIGHHRGHNTTFRANVWVFDANGQILVVADDVAFAAQAQDQGDSYGIPEDIDRWRYRARWERVPAVPAEAPAAPAHWLVLADAGGVAEQVRDHLLAAGQACTMVRPGEAWAKTGDDSYTVGTHSHDDLSRVVSELGSHQGPPLRAVVDLWPLDTRPAAAWDAASIGDQYAPGVLGLTDLVRAVTAAELPRAPRVWVVTSGAQPVGDVPASLELMQAMVWGTAKGIVLEHAELQCARIDLPGVSNLSAEDIAAMCDEFLADRIDDQIAFRAGERYIARMAHELAAADSADVAHADPGVLSPTRPYSVLLGPDGAAQLRRSRSHSPGAGEVEVRVELADVGGLRSPGHSVAGLRIHARQSIGRILRCGTSCGDLQVGQRVLVLDGGPLDSHRVVSAGAVVPLPAQLDAALAITAVRAYVVALFVLREMGAVSPREPVLVRMGKGSIGLALARVARWLGAHVIVSAPASWHETLRAMQLGNVFDEAAPGARAALDALLGGSGVGVLVNDAAGLENSLSAHALRSFGRCIDISEEPVTAGLFRSCLPGNVSLTNISVDSMLHERRDACQALAAEVLQHLASGTFGMQPAVELDLSAWRDASESPDVASLVRLPWAGEDEHAPRAYRADGTYVITGGLGGLGLNIAMRMVRDGARHVVLLGRSAPSLAAIDVLAELEDMGAHCVAMSVDVADPVRLAEVFGTIRSTMPPVRGVIHAAGILDNGLISQMDHKQVLAVMPAKVEGAWHLHQITAQDPLEFFVLFSSLASFIGSPGQSNYAAANAFLEALAEDRRISGLPGVSIAWGPWAEAGMAANTHNLQRLAQHGMGMLSLEKGLDLLEDVIAERQGGALGALPMNWAAWGRTRGYAAQTPYFSGLVPQGTVQRGNHARITADTLAGLPVDKQMELLMGAVMRSVCQSMMMDAEGVDVDMPLSAMGLDSIIALELKDRIESAVDVVVRTNALIAGKSVRILARQFLDEMTLPAVPVQPIGLGEQVAEEVAAVVASVREDDAALLERIGELSAEEIETILAQMSMEDEGG